MDTDHRLLHTGGFRGQSKPGARAIGVKFCGVKRAYLHQFIRIAAFRVIAIRHIAIQKLTTLIIAHIDHDPAIGVHNHFGILMLKAAQSRALFRLRARIIRINLGNIAVAVRFILLLRNVKAWINFPPSIATIFATDTIALLRRILRKTVWICCAKISVKVLFTSQIGAPRGAPIAAIIKSSQHGDTLRVGICFHQSMPASGAGNLHRLIRRESAIIARIFDNLPPAIDLFKLDRR